jgi:hypothetical protein
MSTSLQSYSTGNCRPKFFPFVLRTDRAGFARSLLDELELANPLDQDPDSFGKLSDWINQQKLRFRNALGSEN